MDATSKELRIVSNLGPEIGSGAFGQVFAYGSYRTCVKVIEGARDSEYKILLALKGKRLQNVCRIFDVVSSSGIIFGCHPKIYVVMERLFHTTESEKKAIQRVFGTGGQLYETKHVFEKHTKDALRTLRASDRRVALDLVNGAKELMRLGINHYDLHTGNVMKTKEGTFKYIDFGLACFVDRCKYK
jgi:serine/threonine protein kinase